MGQTQIWVTLGSSCCPGAAQRPVGRHTEYVAEGLELQNSSWEVQKPRGALWVGEVVQGR